MARRTRYARQNAPVAYEGEEYPTWASTPAPVKRKISREPKPARYKFRTGSDGGVTFKQARVIGQSIGNMAAYCPSAEGFISHQEALNAMGMTAEKAKLVIDAMSKAGVVRWHRGIPWVAKNGAKAAQILTRVGGVSCSVARKAGGFPGYPTNP